MLCSSDEDGEEGQMVMEGSESDDGGVAVEGEESDDDASDLAAAFDSGGEGESSEEDEGASSDDDDEDERRGAAATKGAKHAAPEKVCGFGGGWGGRVTSRLAAWLHQVAGWPSRRSGVTTARAQESFPGCKRESFRRVSEGFGSLSSSHPFSAKSHPFFSPSLGNSPGGGRLPVYRSCITPARKPVTDSFR